MKTLKEITDYTLSALKQGGASDAVAHASFEKCEEFNVDGGEFSLLRTVFNRSLSLVAYKDGKKGAISLNSHETDKIDGAVADCIAAADSGVADEAYGIAPFAPSESFESGALKGDRDMLFTRAEELLCNIKEKYPTIMIEQMMVSYGHSEEHYGNTNGVDFSETGGAYTVSLMFSAHEGDKSSSFCCADVTFTALDKPLITLGDINEQLESATKQVDTSPVSGKFVGTMLLPPSNFNSFLQMALENFACDETLIDGTSPWKEKLGQTVADSRFTVSAAPLDERIVCGQRFTGDGYKSENYDIIKDGKLCAFKLSRYGAEKTGLPRAKNSSWNLIVPQGDTSLSKLIKGISRGLLVGRFSGGHPGVNGEFSGVAKNSFLIEDGKIVGAVSETMISGNLIEMLRNLRGLSADTVCDGSFVLPWAAFDGITVSGK